MEGSFGRQRRASEHPQYPAATTATKTTARQLQELQQVNTNKSTHLNLVEFGAWTMRPVYLQIEMTSSRDPLSSYPPQPFGLGPCFHRLKVIPVSGFHLLRLKQRDGYFHLRGLDRWSTGTVWVSTSFHDPIRHTAQEKDSSFTWHTCKMEQMWSQGRWGNEDGMKDKLKEKLSVWISPLVGRCTPCGGILLHP